MNLAMFTVLCLVFCIAAHFHRTYGTGRDITIHRSTACYIASLVREDQKTVDVGAGLTIEAALGDLITRNPNRFPNFTVSYSASGQPDLSFRTSEDAAEYTRKSREVEADFLSRQSR